MASAIANQTVKAGQRWRNPDDGYLMDVVKVEPNGDAWVRHPNSSRSILTVAAWFGQWELLRDVLTGGKDQ